MLYWIYKYFDEEEKPLYVGLTTSLNNRNHGHRSDSWYDEATKIEVGLAGNEISMKIWEKYYIGTLQPKYNIKDNGIGIPNMNMDDINFVSYSTKEHLPSDNEIAKRIKNIEYQKYKNADSEAVMLLKKRLFEIEKENLQYKRENEILESSLKDEKEKLKRKANNALKDYRKIVRDEIFYNRGKDSNSTKQTKTSKKPVKTVKEYEEEIDFLKNKIISQERQRDYLKEIKWLEDRVQILENSNDALQRDCIEAKKELDRIKRLTPEEIQNLKEKNLIERCQRVSRQIKRLRKENEELVDELNEREYSYSYNQPTNFYENNRSFWTGYSVGRRRW